MSVRTRAELQYNNPFRRTVEVAQSLMPKRPLGSVRRFEAPEPGAFGTIDPGTLALLGLALTRRSSIPNHTVAGMFLMWAAPDIRPGATGSIAGEVSVIDVGRKPRVAARNQTTTSVTLYSAPITPRGSRVGIHLRTESGAGKLHEAAVSLVHTISYSTGAHAEQVGTMLLSNIALMGLDNGNFTHVPIPHFAACLPAIRESNAIMQNVVTDFGSAMGVRVPTI